MKNKTIVVSGVNIRKGGTLTIMRDCLRFLSEEVSADNRVVALVHDKSLFPFDGIEFIECKDSAKSWFKRLRTEYYDMYRISKEIGHINLWLSLHDTTPRVEADVQAVYCQTSFPFLRWHIRDGLFDKKIPLFALFTRFAYRVNVHRNKALVVQQRWLRDKLSTLLGVRRDKFIVFPPQKYFPEIPVKEVGSCVKFSFVSTPDCHKNFETLCEAAEKLERKIGKGKFKVILTISGKENKYSNWIFRKWGHVDSIEFRGFLDLKKLVNLYAETDCLVFPSRVETWGLPISEFMATGKPLLLADLPYAHETSAGAPKVAFFPAENSEALCSLMNDVVNKDYHAFAHNIIKKEEDTAVSNWAELFNLLIGDKIENAVYKAIIK